MGSFKNLPDRLRRRSSHYMLVFEIAFLLDLLDSSYCMALGGSGGFWLAFYGLYNDQWVMGYGLGNIGLMVGIYTVPLLDTKSILTAELEELKRLRSFNFFLERASQLIDGLLLPRAIYLPLEPWRSFIYVG